MFNIMMSPVLTLAMHTRENTESDANPGTIYLEIDRKLGDRLEKLSRAAIDLRASVSISVHAGEDKGKKDVTVDVTATSDGRIDIFYEKLVRHAWPVSVFATGILTVSMISRALKKTCEFPEPVAVGVVPNESTDMFLFAQDRLDDEALADAVDETMDDDPDTYRPFLHEKADAVVSKILLNAA